MSRADRTASLHAQALSVFSESFVRDRRVVVVGDSALGIGERLLELGARTVHLYDTAEGPPKDATARGLTVRRLGGDFEVRDGAFDLALVPDLGEVPDPSGLLTRLRRVVSEAGALVCAAKNPQLFPGEGIEYSELYDLVALQFENVAVSGQIAWGGVAFARLGDDGEARDVTVDSQLVAEPPPIEGYVIVASQSEIEPDAYVIVQLPGDAGRDAPDSVEFAQARLRAELLTAQLEEQRALSTRLQQEIQSRGGDMRAEIEAARESQRESQGRLEARVQQADVRAQQAEARAQQAEARAQQEFARAERLVQNAKDLGEVVDGEREEAKRLAREVEAERKARKKLEIEAQLLREQVETSERPGIRVLSPRRGRIADVETTVAIREDELASLADELEAGPGDRAPDSSEAVTIPRSDQVAIKLKAESARRAAAEESLRRAEDALRAAEDAARAALARAVEAEAKLKGVEMRAEESEQRADDAERRLQELEDEVARAEGRAQRAEERIGRFEAEAQTIGEALAQELSRHEAQLRERGQAIAELQREIVRREHMIHELLSALDERGGHHHEHTSAHHEHAAPNGGGAAGARVAEELATQRADAERLRTKLEALSHELARYQGELFARDWRIQELEQNLSLADAGASSPPSRASASAAGAPEVEALRRELAKSEEELSALRQALTQEHAARVHAESGHPEAGPDGGSK
jgi:predicted  nucleic acid-binding Zn-ribbon protein